MLLALYDKRETLVLKISTQYKNDIFKYIEKIFCVDFWRYPLKFNIKYLTQTLKDVYFDQSLRVRTAHI